MAVRTDRALAIAIGIAAVITAHGEVRAEPRDLDIIGREPSWQIEDVELRTTYLDQRGHGYQAQGAAVGEPGSERMWLVEPWARMTIRQSADIIHVVELPVDAITAASPDAVDATTSASRRNVSEDFDVRTQIRRSDTDTWTTRIAAHHEEPLSSGTIGGGWKRSLADDNATIAINGAVTIDGFDEHDHTGRYLGKTARATLNANIAASQLLSPTTMIDASYGVTQQQGTMDLGWNAVPVNDGSLADERLPRDRRRHAASVRIAQHVPITRSTFKAAYRGYLDDWGVHAHTVELSAYQYVVDWLYVRGGFRFHHQTGVDFFTTALPMAYDPRMARTADSDLAAFDATEWSVELVTVRERGPLRRWAMSAELMRYVRTNDLRITAVSFGVARAL